MRSCSSDSERRATVLEPGAYHLLSDADDRLSPWSLSLKVLLTCPEMSRSSVASEMPQQQTLQEVCRV